jgi:nucleotide-binding universal stress UspA family protein
MAMISTILVPLDGSPTSERALPYATALARAARASLVLMHAHSSTRVTREQMSEIAASEELREAAEKVRAGGLTVQTRIWAMRNEDAAASILDGVRERQADLIVMSTHGRGGVGRWLYGSVADEVVRKSTVPVLLVSAACEHPWPEDRSIRVLVPLDGSPLAEEVLQPTTQLAAAFDGELLLVRVVGPLDYSFAEGVPYLREGVGAQLSEARKYLEELADAVRATGLTVATSAETGPPARVITDITRDRGVDLIAMATHGSTGLARLTMGSVTTGVLHRAHVPLLVIRPTKIR